MTQQRTELSRRYRLLGLLGQGGMGAVYRAVDRLSGEEIALKRLGFTAEREAAAGMTQPLITLAREFQTVAALRHPNIISVYDYGFDTRQQPYFTMELLHNAQDIRAAANGKNLSQQVKMLLDVLQALVYLHRHNLLHRDLKPANILISHNEQTKVLDFGLAAQPEMDRGLAGTLNYMAPELLRGEPLSAATDLYAFGVIACEVLTGHHPFPHSEHLKMLAAVLQDEPDLSGFPDNGKLQDVVARLLARHPLDRYRDAYDVLVAICDAMNQPIPEETRAIRESILQASRFVGRVSELAQLESALEQAIGSSGSRWLIAGESGIGKSRLIEELRIRALTHGVDVLRGQAVDGGSLPFQMWHNLLRTLALSVDVTDLELAVLLDIVPDLAQLLEREPSSAPNLNEDARRQRLIGVFVDLFRRIQKPVLLILEDLQWADSSLEALVRLNLLAPDLPLMIVGTYRSDEMPDLPQRLPDMQQIALSRLTEQEISTLSRSMLGTTGEETEVLDLLQRETEGNVYFLVEVIRALAEDAGRLTDIGRVTLPHHVITGGIEHIIRRRLGQVPLWGQEYLKLAAILGREIDVPVLRAIETEHALKLDEWLLACNRAGVLEIHEQRWRFAHDKLRERVLQDLGQTRADLFRRVAQAFTAVHGSNPAYAAKLADLWHNAGASDEMLRHTLLAAPYLIEVSAAYAEAGRLLQRALGVLSDTPQTRSERMEILRWLAASREGNSHYAEAERLYQESIAIARELNQPEAVHICLRGLMQVKMRQGRFKEAEEVGPEMLQLATASGDDSAIANVHANLGVIHYYSGNFPVAQEAFKVALTHLNDTTEDRLRGRIYANYATLLQAHGHYEEGRNYLTMALEIFQLLGLQRDTANALVNLGMSTSMLGDHDAALDYYQRSLNIFKTIGERSGESLCLYNIGAIYNERGDFAASYRSILESLEIRQRIHDLRGVLFSLDALAENCIALGLFQEARERLLAGYEVAAQMSTPVLQYKLLLVTSKLFLNLEHPEQAAEVLGALSKRPQRTRSFEDEVARFQGEIRQKIADEILDSAYQRGEQTELATMLERIQQWLRNDIS